MRGAPRRHPQSQERGITLDLGFSSFAIDAPEHIAAQGPRGRARAAARGVGVARR